MFKLPAIFGAPRYLSESPGVMPLNALNSSSQTCGDDPLSHGLPSYEEAVTNGSMFGLFNVTAGDDLHNHPSPQHHHHHNHHYQHQHYNNDNQPPLYHSLPPTGSEASESKAASQDASSVPRVMDAAERLDLSSDSLDSQGTRHSRISVVSALSVQRTPSPKVQPRNSDNQKVAEEKGGKGTGSGSGGWRKHLTVERSTLSVAKDRLYRVFSPVLRRKQDHHDAPKQDGSHSKRGSGDKKGEAEETTSHPVRMRISSGRHDGADPDCFDDIRSAGKRSGHKHKHRHNNHK